MVNHDGRENAGQSEANQEGASACPPPGKDRSGFVGGEGPDARDELGALANSLDHEITWMGRLLNRAQYRLSYPLERSEYAILLLLERRGPQCISDIAHMLLLENSTATRQISAMTARGLLKREVDPSDNRRIFIHSESKGTASFASMRSMRIEVIELLLRDWSTEDQRKFVTLLDRYNNAIIDRLHLARNYK